MSSGGTPAQAEAVQAREEQLRDLAESLAYRERQLTHRAMEMLEGPSFEAAAPRLTPEQARKYVSDAAYDLIVRHETGGREYYESYYKSAPVWPGYSSGVTIGFGYDLGYVKEAEFVEVWGKLLPAHDIERLKEGIGLSGGDAQPVARRLKDIRVSWEVSETVFARNTLPKFVGLTMNALENFDDQNLHPHSLGALVSLVFNRGADFSSKSDKRLEMRHIREHMESREFVEIPDEFRDMKRHWTSAGLKKRRDEEAALFARGLQAMRDRITVSQPAPVTRPDPVPRPATPAQPASAPAAPVASGAPQADPLSHVAMPTMPTAAPSVGGAPAPAASPATAVPPAQVASQSLGIPLPPEMGGQERVASTARLESMYGAEAPGTKKVSLEDDWYEYDQLPIEKIERPSILESSSGSYSIAKVRWAGEDNEIPDYKHVSGLVDGDGAFDFTAADLDTIIKANRYRPVTADHGKILFGLRGCQLVGETASQIDKDALKLKIARPNHQNFRCTIGVYDTKTRKLSGFIASTVPNRGSVYTCWVKARDGEELAGNMMPTGCYGYIIGPHIGSSTTPGCFLLRESIDNKRLVGVWRSTDDVTYTVQDEIDVCRPGNNIHPAFSASSAEFSSMGCQTIRGNGGGQHTGEWALFRVAAGQPKEQSGKVGTPYSYVLTTGVEARIASSMRVRGELNDDAKMRARLVRLRQGSQGEEVKALQAALGMTPTGIFGANEAAKVAEWQAGTLSFNDGIYAMEYDAHLKVAILSAPPAPAAAPTTVAVGQPAPIPRPDPVARPDTGAPAAAVAAAAPNPGASLGGDGSTAAGWGLESVGGRARPRVAAARSAPVRIAALESPGSRSHIQGLLNEDDGQLVRRLGQITEQVKANPRRAGELELVAQMPTPMQEGIFDAMAEVGERVYGRIEPELFRIICGSSSADAKDRTEIQKALSTLASPAGGNKAEVVTAVASVIMGSGLAYYGIALVIATIFVRRFANATLQETCRVWGARRRLGARSEAEAS